MIEVIALALAMVDFRALLSDWPSLYSPRASHRLRHNEGWVGCCGLHGYCRRQQNLELKPMHVQSHLADSWRYKKGALNKLGLARVQNLARLALILVSVYWTQSTLG